MALNRNTAELRTLHRTTVAWEATALPLSYTRIPRVFDYIAQVPGAEWARNLFTVFPSLAPAASHPLELRSRPVTRPLVSACCAERPLWCVLAAEALPL